MPWKKDKDVLVIGSDGNPIWITGEGAEAKELSVSGDTIPRLQREAQTHRTAKEAAEAKVAAFADLDPVKAREALDKLALIDTAQLIDAGKHQQVIEGYKAEATAKLTAKEQEIEQLRKEADDERITAAFAASPFIREKIGLGPDLVKNMLGNKFAVKDKRVVAVDQNGNPMSGKQFGEVASFDEAIEAIVMSRPDKDSLLRGVNGGGSGGSSGGGADGRKRTVTRSDFRKFNPVERRAFIEEEGKGTAQLVD